jgi:outer membrane receptor protein involved in Fe transport
LQNSQCLWTTYDFSIGNLDGFRVGAGVSYTDKTYGNTANTVWIPSAEVIDAMIGYYQLNPNGMCSSVSRTSLM